MSVSKRFLVLALTLGLWAGPPQAATFDVDDLSKPAPAPEAREAAPALAGIGAKLDAQGKLELLKAIQLFGKGEYVPAEAIARRLTEVSPEEPDAWYLLGLLLANMDQREDAVKALDEAASRYSTNADPLIFKGDIEMSLGQTEAAVSTWERAALRDPANWRAQERLAAIAEQQGNLAEAARRYDLSIKESGALRSFPRLQLSRLALLEGQPEQVEPLLKELAATENAPDAALDYLARALIGLDRLAEAEPLLDRLVERGTSARAFPHLARIYITQGKGAEAEALMTRAAAAFPEDGGILLEQGRILGAVGKYQEAGAVFDQALAKHPANRAILNAASLAKARLGAMDDALALARKAAGTPDAAVGDRMWLAALLEKSGAAAEAVPLYRKILETEPQNWVALNNLASLLTATAPVEAVRLAEMASALAPEVAPVRDTLGWAQFKAGQVDAAEATFRALRKSNPDSALPAYRLGLVLAATGRTEEAKPLLTDALARDPASAHAETARKVLDGQAIAP